MKNRGFTDKLYFANLIATWVFVLLCFILTIFSGYLGVTDMAIAAVGIPAAFTELGIHTGFVVWKAKNENICKFNDVEEEIDNDLDY